MGKNGAGRGVGCSKKSDIMKLKRVKKGDQTSGTLRRRNVCFLNTLVGLLTHFNLKDDRDFEF